jgi:glyceraldehyde 3-phosphate dehydrogenase
MQAAISTKQIIEKLQSIEKAQTHKVIETTTEPVTAIDFAGQDHSAIVDLRWLKVVREKLVHIQYWYDNEWGYSSRVVDAVAHLANQYLHNTTTECVK